MYINFYDRHFIFSILLGDLRYFIQVEPVTPN